MNVIGYNRNIFELKSGDKMDRLRKFSAAVLAAVMLSMSGCAVETNTSFRDGRSVSEIESSEVDSSQADSLESVFSEVSSSDNDTSDESTMSVSIPDIDISIPAFSVPSFNISSSNSETSSNSSSETKSDRTVSESSGSSSSSWYSSDSDKTQTIGNSDVGYLDVPANFVKFYDLDSSSDVQYSDPAGTIIFTMNNQGNAKENDTTVEQVGMALSYNMEQEGAQDVTRATVKVGDKYDAKQVYGYYPEDDTYLVVDLLEKDGNIIFLSAEFPAKDIYMVTYLDTYHY